MSSIKNLSTIRKYEGRVTNYVIIIFRRNKLTRLKLVCNNGDVQIFLGVNKLVRKIAKSSHSTTKLTRDETGRYALQTKTLKCITQTVDFMPNEEFEEKTWDGRKVKSTIVFDGNKLIHTQHGDIPLIIERRFFNDEMICVMTYSDAVCTTWSKLIE